MREIRSKGRLLAAAMLACAAHPAMGSVLTLYAGATGAYGTCYSTGLTMGNAMLIQPLGPGVTVEARAAFEIALASIPANAIISSATLSVYNVQKTAGLTNDRIGVIAYSGDGQITSNDFTPGFPFYIYNTTFPSFAYTTLNVTPQISSLYAAHAGWAGFNYLDTTYELALFQLSPVYNASLPTFSTCPKIDITYSFPDRQWAVDSGGSWNASGNWLNGQIPNAPGVVAQLGSVIHAPATVTIATNVSVGTLALNSNVAYTVAGPGSLTLNSGTSGFAATLNIVTGSHAISAPLVLASNLSVVGTGNVVISTIDGPFGVTFASTGTTQITTHLALTGISIPAGSALDTTTAAAVLTNQSVSSVRSLIALGRLTTSSAGDITIFGVIPNLNGFGQAQYTTFMGMNAPVGATLLRFTYIGDTNLDGRVDGNDLANALAGLHGHLTGWTNGDFDYDGQVTDSDIGYLINALIHQGAPFEDPSGGGNSGGIPEPGHAAALLPLAALGRRRRVTLR